MGVEACDIDIQCPPPLEENVPRFFSQKGGRGIANLIDSEAEEGAQNHLFTTHHSAPQCLPQIHTSVFGRCHSKNHVRPKFK